MSDLSTKTMLEAYKQDKAPSQFFTKRFKPKYFKTKSIEIDIVRSEEDVAIAIQDIAAGSRMNSADIYTNKELTPPVFDEAIPLNVFDLMDRSPGAEPFADLNFQAIAMLRMFDGMRKVERKIIRSVELQGSQIMQTGIVTLKDSNGVTLFSVDYKPKATHFPDASPIWGGGSENVLGDIQSLADVIRVDGLVAADMLTFGGEAWNVFIRDTDVQALLDNRRMELGGIAPEKRGDEATYQGWIMIGDYRFEMWSVASRYKDPETGVSTPYMDPKKVIVEASGTRKVAAYGFIPSFVAPDRRVLPFLPSRISDAGGGIDLFPTAYVTLDGKNLIASVASRPLLIPVAIDTYGCLDTKIA